MLLSSVCADGKKPVHCGLQAWMASGYLWFKEENSLSTERALRALIHCVAHSGSFIQLPKDCYGQVFLSPAFASPQLPAGVNPADCFLQSTLQTVTMAQPCTSGTELHRVGQL